MSRYHGEQYWVELRHHAMHGWRDLNDDDLDTLDAIRHDHEVRNRDLRSRVRRDKQSELRELDH
ncbi:MAG TPA: hypothetical protein VFB32_01180 [Rudaea sp.]|nr:hypothetical protein [Rudaea sp.]